MFQGAINFEFFEHAGTAYLAVANYNNNQQNTKINSVVYRRENERFVVAQQLPSLGAFDIESFVIDSSPCLAIAHFHDSSRISFEISSTIWRMDPTGTFVKLQDIATKGATNFQAREPIPK